MEQLSKGLLTRWAANMAALQGEEDEEARIADERKSSEILMGKIRRAGIPLRYQACNFANIERKGVPADVAQSYAMAKAYAGNLNEELKKGYGLLMAGTVGRMKTTLAAAIGIEAIRQRKTVFFVNMAELLDQMMELSRRKSWEEMSQYNQKITDRDLVIIDDLGAEYSSGWVLNKVDALITRRYNDMKATIITTNMTPEEMQGRYSGRVFDRLKNTSHVIIETGPSLRPRALELHL